MPTFVFSPMMTMLTKRVLHSGLDRLEERVKKFGVGRFKPLVVFNFADGTIREEGNRFVAREGIDEKLVQAEGRLDLRPAVVTVSVNMEQPSWIEGSGSGG